MGRPFLVPFAILLTAILLRGAFLEYLELVDPTETRYASVAQEMVLLGDWVTPKLPMPEGVIPYLGKPPMHFWLTAVTYELFGFDEWTARLPSWFATIAILMVIVSFGRKVFSEQVGFSAGLIAFSSVFLFFLAGASVIDVTLTAFTAASTYFLYLCILSNGSRKIFGLLSSAFMACGFLTKGPIAIVLVWFPLFLWSTARRDFRWLKSLPWISCFILFLVVTVPWFAANEIHNPGSLRYFFWNENVARYLFKDYGDKYGSGHTHMYGFSWIMLFAAFMPWSLVLTGLVYVKGWRPIKKRLETNQHLLFALMWGVGAAIFFTFVQQLHPLYVLPCVPGLALFCAALLHEEEEGASALFKFISGRRFVRYIGVLLVAIIALGAILEFSSIALLLGLFLGGLGMFIRRKLQLFDRSFAGVQLMSFSLFLVYLVAIASISPYIDERASAGELLNDLADATVHEAGIPRVGIVTKNHFSLYWTSKAGNGELSREVRVQYVEPGSISKEIGHIILRSRDAARLSERERASFALTKKRGEWLLYSRKRKVVSE